MLTADTLRSSHPPVAVSRQTTAGFKTGAWRNITPRYVKRLPPCREGCPAGNDVLGWVTAVARGDWDTATTLLESEQPLPAVCGRVCYHPCEWSCNRRGFDESVAIRAIERSLGDRLADRKARKQKHLGESARILIVGSGPGGLACAWTLATMGYRAEIVEQAPLPGGLLRYGIPTYRLPKDVLDREIHRIRALGVNIQCGREWDRHLGVAAWLREYDGIYLTPGAAGSTSSGLAVDPPARLMNSAEFLAHSTQGVPIRLTDSLRKNGKPHLAVIGGGNSALDAARTGIRLGAEVTVLYRRTRAEMPAYAEEVEAALEEGVRIEYLVSPVRYTIDRRGAPMLRCLRNVLGKPDADGRRRPEIIPGSEFELPASLVVDAVGERPQPALLTSDPDEMKLLTKIDVTGETGIRGVWCGGDFSNRHRTVAHAIGDGKRAAMAIYARLAGEPEICRSPEFELSILTAVLNDESTIYDFRAAAGTSDLNLGYFHNVDRLQTRRTGAGERVRSFVEIELSASDHELAQEAGRCFHCGACDDCGNCHVLCPDGAVVRDADSGRLYFDLDHCKGCAICAAECPRAAIAIR